MVGRVCKKLVNNILQSLRLTIGKKSLGQIMLANILEKILEVTRSQEDNTLEKEVRNTTSENNRKQLELLSSEKCKIKTINNTR